MSGRLWRIEIVGEKQYRQEDILSYLKKKQISYGISTDNISCEELEENLREDYPDIAWVSCELRGTMLRISLSEVLNPKQNEEENTPCHLIATKEGTVDSIITRQGVPKVKKGSRVKKGQVLISGTVELTDDFGEKLSKTYVCASGDIYVRRNIVYQDKLSYMNYQKRYTGEQNQIYRVKFSFQEPQMIVTLPTSLKSLENVDREIRRYPVKLGKNFYLPVTFYKIIEKEYVAQKKINTPKEGKAILKHRLQAFLAEYEAKGVEILKNNVRIDCDKKECTAKGILVIREKIGKKKKIGGKRQRGVHK